VLVGLPCAVVQGGGVRIAEVCEGVGDGLQHELVVPVRLLGKLPLGRVVRVLRLLRLAQELGLVLDEEVELTADQVAETIAAEDQSSSS